MTYNQLRVNVRNFLVGLTMSEMAAEWDISVAMGNTQRADYIGEYMREVESEFLG